MVEQEIERAEKLGALTIPAVETNEDTEKLRREAEKLRREHEEAEAERRAFEEARAEARVHREKADRFQRAAVRAVVEWCYLHSHHLPPERAGVAKARETRLVRELAELKQEPLPEGSGYLLERRRHRIAELEVKLPTIKDHADKQWLADVLRNDCRISFSSYSRDGQRFALLFCLIVQHVPSPFSNGYLRALGLNTKALVQREEELREAAEAVAEIIAKPETVVTDDALWKEREIAAEARRTVERHRQYKRGRIDNVVDGERVVIAGSIEWRAPRVEEAKPNGAFVRRF
jgi:hypothetical protein